MIKVKDYLRVGVITKTHGIIGEVKVYPTTNDITRYDTLKKVILSNGKDEVPVEIKHVKYFKDLVIVKFKGINNINDVEKYVKYDILIERKDAIELDEDENFICDLIGLKVVTDEGNELGELTDVLQTGANDVYVVALPDKKEVLLPAIKQCILDVNLEDGIMTVHVMKGLMD